MSSPTAGVTTIVTMSFGGNTIFRDYLSAAGITFGIEGLIIKRSGNNQEIGVKALYNSGVGNANHTATTLNMGVTQILAINAISAGGGETVYTLIVRHISAV